MPFNQEARFNPLLGGLQAADAVTKWVDDYKKNTSVDAMNEQIMQHAVALGPQQGGITLEQYNDYKKKGFNQRQGVANGTQANLLDTFRRQQEARLQQENVSQIAWRNAQIGMVPFQQKAINSEIDARTAHAKSVEAMQPSAILENQAQAAYMTEHANQLAKENTAPPKVPWQPVTGSVGGVPYMMTSPNSAIQLKGGTTSKKDEDTFEKVNTRSRTFSGAGIAQWKAAADAGTVKTEGDDVVGEIPDPSGFGSGKTKKIRMSLGNYLQLQKRYNAVAGIQSEPWVPPVAGTAAPGAAPAATPAAKPAAAGVKDQYGKIPGQMYYDASGQKATYLGNNKWGP